MKIKDLISKLKKMPQDLEVTISDGYNYKFYKGDYEIILFEEEGIQYCDIGVGGCDVKDE
jgi:hypothetical protein